MSGEDPEPRSSDEEARGKRFPLAKLLQFAIAAGLLLIVARSVPFSDALLWEVGGETYAIPGTIEGDWKSDAIEFEIAGDYDPPASFSPAARSELGPTARLDLAREGGPRAERLGGVFSWRPGLPRVFGELDPRGLVLAFGGMFIALLSVITRWWRLLAAVDCRTSWTNALRLTFLGLFFNIVVPGLTGGDLIKAFLVVRENPLRRADALVSVFVDRLLGLLALAALAAVMILYLGGPFTEIRLPVLVFLFGGIFGGLMYTSSKTRRVVRFEKLLDLLPFASRVKKIDRALLRYSEHPKEVGIALGLSFVNHFVVVGAIFSLGRAFGDALPWSNYLAVVPVANIVSSLPIAPGGWGVGEAAYGFLFSMVGASATIGVAVSVTFRLCLMSFGLLGGIFLILPGNAVRWREIRTETAP